MLKDVNGRFDYYSISPKVRHILFHWGYELVRNNLLRFIFNNFMAKMFLFL